MAREPQRREQPAQLSAAIVPLERALIARAKALKQMTEAAAEIDPADAVVMARLSTEFRALAEELKYW